MDNLWSWLFNQAPSIVILGTVCIYQFKIIQKKDGLLHNVSEKAIKIATMYQALGGINSQEHKTIIAKIEEMVSFVKFHINNGKR